MNGEAGEITLREYIDLCIKAEHAAIQSVKDAAAARADAQDKAVNAALTTTQAAIMKAESATEKRFESVNEFRGSLGDQARTLMPRAESEALHKASADRNESAQNALAERINNLSLRLNSMDAGSAGKQIGWASVVSVIAVITSVAGLVMILFNMKG
jgi:hypothetical protein